MIDKQFDPKEIDTKWQEIWEKDRIYATNEPKEGEEKYYVLDMFPYPSGEGLHVGHPKGYVFTDIIARYQRMQGKKVLHPMGLDSFGLPAENFAIKTGTHPAKVIEKNSARFYQQLKLFGFSYDWEKKISTCDPDYYKWTQWIFLKMWENGLAYQAEMPINWCPSCKTGIANEEVVKGKCERCGTTVTKKFLKQWVLRIRNYAERLINDLDTIDWPDSIKDMQRNWIGRSEGAKIRFKVENPQSKEETTITVFTTRPDTINGATFMVLAPEIEMVAKLTTKEQQEKVETYIEKTLSKSSIERKENKEKTGVFTGSYAINPVNGNRIPIWIADYVLADYGEGAIMAVPAHDQRDWEFAKKFDLPIIQVITDKEKKSSIEEKAYEDIEDGFLTNSAQFNDLAVNQAIGLITDWMQKEGYGEKAVEYRIHDWIFSRQRYWGEPIPLIHCPKCGIVPVPYEELPLTLPMVEKYEPTDTGESPLSKMEEWVNVSCPKCGEKAKRETNTMPQWAGSCWYYLRFIDPNNNEELADKEKLKKWLPVDFYVGGAEHAVLHLLYARFWHKFLYDIGVVPTIEPFQKLKNVGMVLGENGVKMSKSKPETIINPDDMIEKYGADTFRAYIMFMGPFSDTIAWDTKGMEGVCRWLNKTWNLAQEIILVNEKIQEDPEQWLWTSNEIEEVRLATVINKGIKKVSEQYVNYSFNTVVSNLMILVNDLNDLKKEFSPQVDPAAWRKALEALLAMMAPVCPHIAEELWHQLGYQNTVTKIPWPKYDPNLVKDEMINIPIQINGKLRGEILMPADASKEMVLDEAKNNKEIKKYLEGNKIVKEIYVEGKIVNLVIK